MLAAETSHEGDDWHDDGAGVARVVPPGGGLPWACPVYLGCGGEDFLAYAAEVAGRVAVLG